jgi:hypothetical protein
MNPSDLFSFFLALDTYKHTAQYSKNSYKIINSNATASEINQIQ